MFTFSWSNVWKTRLQRIGKVLTVLPVVIMVKDCVVDLVPLLGVSMQPTLNPYPDEETMRKYFLSRFLPDIVLVDKMSIRSGWYERGSVVLLRSIGDSRKFLCKRLVAMENEWVINRDGEYVHIPKGHCWVVGDNAKHSIDSNDFGSVPLALILGKVTYVAFPPWRMQKVEAKDCEDVYERPYQV